MAESEKLCIGVALVASALVVIVTIFLLLHPTPAPVAIYYNNTTTVQCNCYEQPVANCSVAQEPIKENVTLIYYSPNYTTESWYWNIDDPEWKSTLEPTPTLTPLPASEFPFLPR